ncbi:MAG TPA: hypothetical protein VNT42_06350 [Sphingomonas sp.]|nr:hypothetical protein [Sphingomonas sp.]
MTIETLFLVLIPTYLVVIAYGVVGTRRGGMAPGARLVSAALMVSIPPLAILAALYATGDAFLIAGWGIVTLAMLASGILTVAVTDYIARRARP